MGLRDEAKNGAGIHDNTHTNPRTGIKWAGFAVPEGGATIDSLKINNVDTDVKGDFGCDVALKGGAIIMVENEGDYIHEIDCSAGQVNYINA